MVVLFASLELTFQTARADGPSWNGSYVNNSVPSKRPSFLPENPYTPSQLPPPAWSPAQENILGKQPLAQQRISQLSGPTFSAYPPKSQFAPVQYLANPDERLLFAPATNVPYTYPSQNGNQGSPATFFETSEGTVLPMTENLPSHLNEHLPFTVISEEDLNKNPQLLEQLLAEQNRFQWGPPALSKYKDGFFQKLRFSGSWLDRSGNGALDITEAEIALTVAIPAPTTSMPLMVTPRFGTKFLNGPASPHLPSRVYDAALALTWQWQATEQWGVQINVTPGLFSDFENVTSDAFQLTGHGAVAYEWVPQRWTAIFGAAYRNTGSYSIIPLAGLIYKPNDDWEINLVVPQVGLSHRFGHGQAFEDWLFINTDIGGGTYQIEQLPGTFDTIEMTDLRIAGGWQRKLDGGAGWKWEAGYSFNSSIEFRSGLPEFDPGDAYFLRGTIDF